ncbi:hypothetical protein ARMGADRAFT_613462 [Armillaria gallica]|uniref:Uncharacterized protein n=1 Tax=Armillaria gallica TaxID=47427 RepID=A0A2H3D0B8_ARMGA|nr:hypothetical protein ARMGADRAFT_613462 [Armillaria gallica]
MKYYEELEKEGAQRITDQSITEEANVDEENTQHAHGLDSSQLRRGCSACHIPLARLSQIQYPPSSRYRYPPRPRARRYPPKNPSLGS